MPMTADEVRELIGDEETENAILSDIEEAMGWKHGSISVDELLSLAKRHAEVLDVLETNGFTLDPLANELKVW